MVEAGAASVHLLRVVQQAGLILVCPDICRTEMYLDQRIRTILRLDHGEIALKSLSRDRCA